ncbi:MAG: 6-phospho-beta-glucosidase [Anaerolineaceae bacterium]|nr:MAG: 6-phospho-beta-glucosidase [Anaerolineaceae bacterium]
MKLTIIGAGSSYTPEVMDGLFKESCFDSAEIALYDLPEASDRLKTVHDLSNRMAYKKNIKMKIHIADTLEEALKGASFVLSQFRVGLLEARILDERIPLQYGLIGQETTGAGGFFNAMRTIPAAINLVRAMERLCPDAWLINFTNPSGIITEAIHRYSNIKCVGLCNVPYNMHMDAAKLCNVDPERVYCHMVGLNHLSYLTEITVDGKSVMQELIDKNMFDGQLVKNVPKVPGISKMISQLQLIPSPYLQYYYFESFMLEKELNEIKDGLGTRGEQVLSVQNRLFDLYKDPKLCEKPAELEKRGGAYYSTVATMLIKALLGHDSINMPVNYPNKGALADLSMDSVVETNCIISKNSVRPLTYGPLPPQIRGLICQIKAYESLTVEASMEKSKKKAILALMNNPLIHGYNNACKLVEEMQIHFGKYIGELR